MTYKAQVSPSEKQILLDNIDLIIDNIWDQYDQDGNDYLDKQEARKFIRDVLRESGLFGNTMSNEVDERLIKEVFHEIDADHNRRISKEEMKKSIAMIIGIA
jgi:Ca2+-binding EF-hand superfamily protein